MIYLAHCPGCAHVWTIPVHAHPEELTLTCTVCALTFVWKWSERRCSRLRTNGTCSHFCTRAERSLCSARFKNGLPIPPPKLTLEQEEAQAANYIVVSGKYQGKTIAEIYALDEPFLHHILLFSLGSSFGRKVKKALHYLKQKEKP